MGQSFKFFSISKETFLFPLFCALGISSIYLVNLNLELTDFPKQMIGMATLEGVDISSRVRSFYYSLLLLANTFLFANGILQYLISRKEEFHNVLPFLNLTSLLGILLMACKPFYIPVAASLNLLISLMTLSGVYFLAHSFIIRTENKAFDASLINLFILTFSISILTRDILFFVLQYNSKLYLNELVLYIGLFLIASLVFVSKRGMNQNIILHLTFVLGAYPVISFLSQEISMISRLSGGVFNSVALNIGCLAGLFVLLYFLVIRKRMMSLDPEKRQLKTLVIFLLGILSLSFYTPMIEMPTEMFELANPTLGMDRLFNYGEIPILESFNSHVLFELFFGIIYHLIHGYHGLDYIAYHFFHAVFIYILSFYFLRRWLKNDLMVLLLSLFFPFITVLFPFSYALVLLVPFFLFRYIQNTHWKNLSLLFIYLLFLIVWKIDFGYSSMLACAVIIVWFHLAGVQTVRFSDVLRASSILLGLIVIVISYSIASGIELWDHFLQALHYVGSAQTYGVLNLSLASVSVTNAQYYFFPVLIIIGLVWMIYNQKELIAQKPFEFISLSFFVIYYLFNYHRGLIRHGLYHGDSWLSSFAFFIIPGFLLLYPVEEKWRHWRKYAFILLSFIIATAFKYPGVEKYEYVGNKLIEFYSGDEYTLNTETPLENRILSDSSFQDKYSELKQFADSFLQKDETFYDYSNSPMLYHYLNRRVPSYFNQPLLSIHDEYLQKRLIRDLKEKKVPMIVYSSCPESWYDKQDGVPKNLRHFYLGEFIHRNYSHYKVLDGYTVWIRNDRLRKSYLTGSQCDSSQLDYYELKKLPGIWANNVTYRYDWQILEAVDTNNNLYALPELDKSLGAFLWIEGKYEWGEQGEIWVSVKDSAMKNIGMFSFLAESLEDRKYLLRLSSQRSWIKDNPAYIEVSFEDRFQLKSFEWAYDTAD